MLAYLAMIGRSNAIFPAKERARTVKAPAAEAREGRPVSLRGKPRRGPGDNGIREGRFIRPSRVATRNSLSPLPMGRRALFIESG